MMKENKLIFSSWFDSQGLIVNYMDVGARGDVSEPWSLFSRSKIKVIGFEPDPVEFERLRKHYPERKYYSAALWGEKTTRPFYLCEWASTSSMYPPAEVSNSDYQSIHWEGRVPIETLKVECVSLDSVLNPEDTPDFIKIDTQGSECEILRGAEQILRNNAPLVLAETWCAEIYSGIPLAHEVMSYMYKLGYQVFDLNVAAAWKHNSLSLPDAYCKAKTVGFDLLFVKRIEQLHFLSERELIKFSGLCELFGFRDYAVAVLESSPHRSENTAAALIQLIKNDQKDRTVRSRWGLKLKRLFESAATLYPSLH